MSLKKKHIKIIREAEITGQLFTGFNHRDHRTKAMPSGSKKTFNRKRCYFKTTRKIVNGI